MYPVMPPISELNPPSPPSPILAVGAVDLYRRDSVTSGHVNSVAEAVVESYLVLS